MRSFTFQLLLQLLVAQAVMAFQQAVSPRFATSLNSYYSLQPSPYMTQNAYYQGEATVSTTGSQTQEEITKATRVMAEMMAQQQEIEASMGMADDEAPKEEAPVTDFWSKCYKVADRFDLDKQTNVLVL